ncbi:hypothetical protein D3C80_976810 [compost metagenome]
MARWIRSERSYTVTISTPSGRLFLSSASRFLTPSMVCWAFSPKRMTMMPPTTSPSPLSSATPRRLWGPVTTSATSPSSSGAPRTLVPSGICFRSSTLFR